MQIVTTPIQTNSVISNQPAPIASQSSKKDWEVGLFECKSIKLAVMSCLCPCCVFGSISQEMGYSWCLCCLTYLITLFFTPIMLIHVILGCSCRKHLRHYYRIKGSIIFDFFAYLLCCPCALYQSAAQIAIERYRKMQTNGRKDYSSGLFRKIGHKIITFYSIPKCIHDAQCCSQSLLPAHALRENNTQMYPQVGLVNAIERSCINQLTQMSQLAAQNPGSVSLTIEPSSISEHKIQPNPQLPQTQPQNFETQSDFSVHEPVVHV
ncbi:unnamed protein product [Heterobilharzia americana]|nr:unnamed protein product [Heterobilharzia americana]CAH8436710.1 unnamed protein product [Heterobilharzia americana]